MASWLCRKEACIMDLSTLDARRCLRTLIVQGVAVSNCFDVESLSRWADLEISSDPTPCARLAGSWMLVISALFRNNCDFLSGCGHSWCPNLSFGRPGASTLVSRGLGTTLAAWGTWDSQKEGPLDFGALWRDQNLSKTH